MYEQADVYVRYYGAIPLLRIRKEFLKFIKELLEQC